MRISKRTKELLERYIEMTQVDSQTFWNKLIISELRVILLLASNDYLKHNISTIDISDIARSLYRYAPNWKPHEVGFFDRSLDSFLTYLSEADDFITSQNEFPEDIVSKVSKYFNEEKKYLEYRKLIRPNEN